MGLFSLPSLHSRRRLHRPSETGAFQGFIPISSIVLFIMSEVQDASESAPILKLFQNAFFFIGMDDY